MSAMSSYNSLKYDPKKGFMDASMSSYNSLKYDPKKGFVAYMKKNVDFFLNNFLYFYKC